LKKNELKYRFKKGSRKAFSVVYDKYCDAMYVVCLRYTKNTDEAADILQESFIKIHEKCKSFNTEYELGGWIKKIVVNTAINHIRYNKRFELVDDFDSFDNEAFFLDDGFDLEDSNDLQKNLLTILKEIPVGYQTIFNLFVFENLSHKEISDYLSISESTSKSQLFKARKLISKILIERKIVKL